MQRSSELIGAIAAALAKAQAELVNPEKSLSATIRSPVPAEVTEHSATPRYPAGSTSCAKPWPARDRYRAGDRDRPDRWHGQFDDHFGARFGVRP